MNGLQLDSVLNCKCREADGLNQNKTPQIYALLQNVLMIRGDEWHPSRTSGRCDK
jgi:hypothetical protein